MLPGRRTAQPMTRAEALAAVAAGADRQRRHPRSIALKGGRIDDVTLARYRETIDPNSPEIVLLSPPGSPQPLLRRIWLGRGDGAGRRCPDPRRSGTPRVRELTATDPVSLRWDNGARA